MENQRTRLSKRLLKESLIELLKNKDILKLSIREICETAEINRTTFYKYYGSQFDLLKDIENDIFEQIGKKLELTDDKGNSLLRKRLVNILIYFQDNLEICRILLNTNIDEEFPEKLFKIPAIRSNLNKHLANGNLTKDEVEYIIEFIIKGGFSIVKKWLNKEKRESPQELSDFIIQLVFKPISKFKQLKF
ncbi:MAG: TetR/AcrR family transcriptional regulator [Clostridiales bacterium]